jgi:hypothetical protein
MNKQEMTDTLVHAVREVYVEERRRYESRRTGQPSHYGYKDIVRWDGGEDRYGRENKPAWPKIVAFAASAGVDPLRLIQATFQYATGLAPTPDDCRSEKAVRAYKARNSSSYEKISLYWKSQSDLVRRELVLRAARYKPDQEDELLLDVLWDGLLAVGPLMRFTLAHQKGLKSQGDWLFPAVLEYVGNRETFDRLLGDRLPLPVRETAAATFSSRRF